MKDRHQEREDIEQRIKWVGIDESARSILVHLIQKMMDEAREDTAQRLDRCHLDL